MALRVANTKKFLPKHKFLHDIRAPLILIQKLGMAENQDKHIVFRYNDPQSPYFLSSSNHSGYIISLVILNGYNYGNWSQLLINALKSKNKLGFVNGTLQKPIAVSDVHALEKCDSIVMACLYNVIDKALHGSVEYANTIREVWIDLEERYP